jgi:ABC-type sugar transport system substrate-binding protein
VSRRSCLGCRQRPRVCGLAIMLLVVALAGCSKPATTSAPDPAESGAATGAAESGRLTIVMIPKATQHTFWLSVRRGALAEFKAANADVLLENRYSGPTIGEAQNTAMNIIDTLRQANGVFASNQTASEGMLRALEQQNLAGRVKFVGFDSSELLVRGLSAGNIDALVVQDPVDMGYQSVKLMVQHLKGEKIEPTVTTGVHLVTKENMNDPEIAPLIAP